MGVTFSNFYSSGTSPVFNDLLYNSDKKHISSAISISILLPTESIPGALLFSNLHNLVLTAFESIVKLLKQQVFKLYKGWPILVWKYAPGLHSLTGTSMGFRASREH